MAACILTRTPWFKANEHKPVHIGMYICRSIKELPKRLYNHRRAEYWTWRYWDGADWHYGLQCKVIKTPFTFEGLGVPCPDVSTPQFKVLTGNGTIMSRDLWDFEWCGINESPEQQVRYS